MAPAHRSRGGLLPVAAVASAAALLGHRLLLTSFAVGSGIPAGPLRAAGGAGREAAGLAARRASAVEAGAALGAAVGEAVGTVVGEVLKTPRSEAKAALVGLLDDDYLAAEVLRPEGKPARGRVDEAILVLERLNPTQEPVYSDILDGTWQVKYSGSYAPGVLSSPTRELALFLYGGGFSLGNALSSFANGFWGQTLGLAVAKQTVRIGGMGRDVEASADLEFAGGKKTLTYSAELVPLSGRRMNEEVMELKLPEPLGTQKPPLDLRRSILITYLDKEVMIVRDESGVPEVLVRELAEALPVAANISAASNTTNPLDTHATATIAAGSQ